jgi:CheY-like chemotaxis protein
MESFSTPANKLVLIVDDDGTVLSLLETYVSLEGFQVITARDGREAREKLAARAPDLVITDLMMPGEGGYELLRSLQADGHRGIPVFVVTAAVIEQSTVDMIKAEANVVEFVPKPIPRQKLIAALHRELRTVPTAPQTKGLNDR